MSQRQTMQLVRGSPGGISEHRGFLIDSITRLAKDDVTADLLFICRYKESQILNIQGRYWVTFLIVGGGTCKEKNIRLQPVFWIRIRLELKYL